MKRILLILSGMTLFASPVFAQSNSNSHSHKDPLDGLSYKERAALQDKLQSLLRKEEDGKRLQESRTAALMYFNLSKQALQLGKAPKSGRLTRQKFESALQSSFSQALCSDQVACLWGAIEYYNLNVAEPGCPLSVEEAMKIAGIQLSKFAQTRLARLTSDSAKALAKKAAVPDKKPAHKQQNGGVRATG